MNAVVLGRQLAQLGYDSITASDGAEAVARVEHVLGDDAKRDQDPALVLEEPPRSLALVLMDLDMPVMNGLAATRAIREAERRRCASRRLPILALTAADRSSREAACVEAGMDGFVGKPTTVALLRPVLDRFCSAPSSWGRK